MTPSKSKTIARRDISLSLGPRDLRVGTFHSFAGMDGDLQTILARWEWALIRGVVVTVRMVGAVEVELVDAGAIPVDVEEPSSSVRFRAAGEVAERHEEAGGFSDFEEREQRHRLTLQRE